jgi:hypothetical protein
MRELRQTADYGSGEAMSADPERTSSEAEAFVATTERFVGRRK